MVKRVRLFRYDPSRRNYQKKYGFKREHKLRQQRPRPADPFFVNALEVISDSVGEVRLRAEEYLCAWLVKEDRRRAWDRTVARDNGRGKEMA